MTNAAGARPVAAGRPKPEGAIDARRQDAAAKVVAVAKAVKALGRTGAPITRSGVALVAGVSRSFTYENTEASAVIAAAQSRTRAGTAERIDTTTAQQQASWRERALNAEDRAGNLRRELVVQRQLVGDLMGRLREPDGTWVDADRVRLRDENEQLRSERNQLARERNDLQRRLDGARANVSRLNQQRVSQLFPDGPGSSVADDGGGRA